MSAQEYLLLPPAALELACRQRGLPTGSKAQMILALQGVGATPADIRAAAGMAAPGASTAELAKLEAALNQVKTLAEAAKLEAASVIGVNNALTIKQDRAAAQTALLLDEVAKVSTAVAAAGAVAARAEAAALAVKPAAVDPAAIRSEIAAAVAAQIKPLGDMLTQASPEVQAEVAVLVAAPVARRTVLEVFGLDLRDRKQQPIMVDVWSDPAAPAVDPVYIWRSNLLRHFVAAQEEGENVWLAGPKGTGKTQAAQQFAARTGRSFTRVNFQKFTSSEDFIGATGLENGATVYKEGDFLLAYQRPGAVVLLDEVSNADAGNLAILNGYLEPGARVNAGGSVRTRAAGVLIFAADNSTGDGDSSGRYAGLRSMNSSFLDRFARMVPLDYLQREEEAQAIVNHTGCTHKLARHVVDCINAARAKVATGDIIDAPSLRQAVAFVKALRYVSIDEAWATTVASKQPAESAAALEAVRSACLNNQTIEGEL